MTTLSPLDTAAETSAVPIPGYKRRIWSIAAAASALVMGISAFGVISSHHEVIVSVDGVARPVTLLGNRVSDALQAAGVEVGPHDKVTPALDSTLMDDSRISVATARPYSVTVDGQRVELWSTARSSSDILADLDASGRNVTIAASRSAQRSPLSVLSATPTTVTVRVDGKEQQVAVPAYASLADVLTAQNIHTSPIDRVQVTHDQGALVIAVQRVTRGNHVTTTEIPFSVEEKEDDTLLEGTTKVETEGVAGTHEKVTYREVVDGKVQVETVISEKNTAEPVTKVILKGTKKPEPKPTYAPTRRVAAGGTAAEDNGAESYSAPAAGGPATSPAGAQAAARKMVAERGWDDDQFQCLVSLWNRESGWNYQAMNRSSGAYGIPQSLPGSKMASAGADWRTNPVTQISWGLGYIAGRYGTPCGALNHSHRRGWY